MSDLPDYAQSVSIDAANVTIPISGSVSIAAGSVTIANASIAVINAAGTKIVSSRPPAELGIGSFVSNPNPSTYNCVIPSDAQALVIELPDPLSAYVHVKIAFHYPSGTSAYVPLELYQFSQQIYVIPILPESISSFQAHATTMDVTIQGTGLTSVVNVYALFEPNPLWLEFFAPPFAEPNQPPIFTAKSLASGVAQWLITPVANVRITIFDFTLSYFTNAGAGDQWYVAHGPSLPGAGAFPANAAVLASGGTAGGWPFNYPLAGSQLPRGDGIYAEVTLSAAANLGSVITSSLD